MNRNEQETNVTYSAADSIIRVWTCIPKDIRAFEKRGAPKVESGVYNDGSPWAIFEFPADRLNIAMAYKPERNLSDEQRAAAAERMAKARAAKGN